MAWDSPEQRKEALNLIAIGRTASEAAKKLGIELTAFQARRRKDMNHPVLKLDWQVAIDEGIESVADRLLTVDEEKNSYNARIWSDNAKWLLARKAAARYGDRLDITSGVTTVDVKQALSDAYARAALPGKVASDEATESELGILALLE